VRLELQRCVAVYVHNGIAFESHHTLFAVVAVKRNHHTGRELGDAVDEAASMANNHQSADLKVTTQEINLQ